ncbi:DUF4097 family beta strand repeat protein [bacterium]|nr:DUF4097 family beta strand repeat protein [bacterium]
MQLSRYLIIVAVAIILLAAAPGFCFETKVELRREGVHRIEVTTVRFDEAELVGLDVDTEAGDIRCECWDKAYMEVRVVKKSRKDLLDGAKSEFGELKVLVETSNGCGEVEVDKASFFASLSAEILCKVPAGRDVELETGGGDMRINGIEGSVKANSGGGNLKVSNCKGPVSLTTGGGNIEIERSRGPLTIKTGGGNMSVQTCSGRVECKTAGGNIELQDCSSGVEAKTGGGDIEAENCRGAVSFKTGGGDIRADGVENIDAKTGGGSIHLCGVSGSVDATTGGGQIVVEACELSSQAKGRFRLVSGGGDIRVKIPGKLPVDASVRIETSSKVDPQELIRCFFPLKRHQSNRGWLFKRTVLNASGKQLGGGFVINIETADADVTIEACD